MYALRGQLILSISTQLETIDLAVQHIWVLHKRNLSGSSFGQYISKILVGTK